MTKVLKLSDMFQLTRVIIIVIIQVKIIRLYIQIIPRVKTVFIISNDTYPKINKKWLKSVVYD